LIPAGKEKPPNVTRLKGLIWQALEDDLRNYMMSEECLHTHEMVAAL
jgi:hypothetical protein